LITQYPLRGRSSRYWAAVEERTANETTSGTAKEQRDRYLRTRKGVFTKKGKTERQKKQKRGRGKPGNRKEEKKIPSRASSMLFRSTGRGTHKKTLPLELRRKGDDYTRPVGGKLAI